MNKKIITRFLAVSCVGGGAFLTGVYVERRKFQNNQQDGSRNIFHNQKTLTPKPALPIFGTVSAATAVVPSTNNNAVSFPGRVSEIMKYGFPGMDNIRSYSDYVLSYDRRNRVAHWTFEHLTPQSVEANDQVDRSKSDFKPDESIHPYFRSLNSDYKGSGFDRGHLAAAGNHRSHQVHVDQTFYLTNMAPQVGVGFNRDSWNRLESYVRKLVRKHKNVFVCTGPLYLPRKEADGKTYVKYEVIGANSVAVPTHFYKVVVCETSDNQLEMESYVMPNQKIDNDTPLKAFQVPPESIERHAGLLFFDKISRQKLRSINGKPV
ncbi:endonuclease G, mitochondrial [Bradysia coprophila]|uniref:endonuclease G, mitochondrial n=1 Tax=Bradysia coprophila TaxID=38358 RepID=UPI00187DBBDF|nr:endonuclease G, mitochondrial [Bradysia coprophila]